MRRLLLLVLLGLTLPSCAKRLTGPDVRFGDKAYVNILYNGYVPMRCPCEYDRRIIEESWHDGELRHETIVLGFPRLGHWTCNPPGRPNEWFWATPDTIPPQYDVQGRRIP